MPILQLQYGGATGALAATPAPTSSLTAFSLPNTASNAVNGGPTPYAFLNGQSQVFHLLEHDAMASLLDLLKAKSQQSFELFEILLLYSSIMI